MSPLLCPASFSAASIGGTVRSMSGCVSCSSLARVSVMLRCFGPLASAVMNGRLTSVCSTEESSIFAFSAASFRRCRAMRSLRRSIPSCFLNSSARKSMIAWSKSSPPRWVSPLVAWTWKTPSDRLRIEMS